MADSSLNASFWVMILMQTLGSVDPMPGSGPRKMPAPRAYVTAIIAWLGLEIVADAGYEEGASKFGWLMVLAALVLGPFGKRIIKLVNWLNAAYGSQGIGTPQNPITSNTFQ